jgi:dipeptidyl-peptidase 4
VKKQQENKVLMKKNIAVLCIIICIITVVSAIAQKKEYTVDIIQRNRDFYGKTLVNVQWYAAGEKYSYLKIDTATSRPAIFTHDVKTGEDKILVSGNDLKLNEDAEPFLIQNYSWSPDEKYILFTGVLSARTLKTGGAFYIYNISDKKFFLLANSEQEQMNAQFSPDGGKLGFVRNNNLFVADIKTGKETQLTFDGSETVINGHFDWVYEEEFSIINGYEWAPDSKSIAFWRLDQSAVPEIQIAKWDSLHFDFLKYHYPKAGDNNSTVKIGIVNIADAKTVWADLGEDTDIYIPRIKFTNEPGVLSVQRLNRLQNKLDLLFVNTANGNSNEILSDSDPCWLEINNSLTFLKKSKKFIWESPRDGYNHFYLYDYKGNVVSQITKGQWEVDKLLGVDEEKETLYYTSSERGSIYRDIYSVKFNGQEKKRLSEKAGSHDITFSNDAKYYIDKYSNANALPAITIYNTEGEKITEIAKSDMSVFKEYGFSPMEFLQFTSSDGTEINAAMIKPAGFNPAKKYPVLIYNYSGPGSQCVLDQWNREMWHQLLAQKGYIIFMLDNRGTGARGKEFRNLVYRNLGRWESNDMIEGAKYLGSLDYVDARRIGIWGWSYGGYMSALTVMKGAEFFKAAIAVAPVTDWHFYDNIYTERYMSLPSLNENGYNTSAVMSYADKLKGKFLLIHGTGDDNVHFQNTVTLVNALIANNKQFETMYYPEREHSIRGGNTRLHLYTLMTNFILKNL